MTLPKNTMHDFSDYDIQMLAVFQPHFIGKWKFIEIRKILGRSFSEKLAYWVHDSGLVLKSSRMME